MLMFDPEVIAATAILEACEAIRVGFQDRRPALQVEVLNDEAVVATGSAVGRSWCRNPDGTGKRPWATMQP
jgi:hypothetical protein